MTYRTFGNHRDRTIGGVRERGGHRGIDRLDVLDAGETSLLVTQAGRVELHASCAQRLQLHLGLPLVDVGELLFASNVLQECVGAKCAQTLLRVPELRRAEAPRSMPEARQ